MKLLRKVRNLKTNSSEDLFFLEITMNWDENWKIRDRFEVKTFFYFFVEITMILEEKYKNTRSTIFFLENTNFRKS